MYWQKSVVYGQINELFLDYYHEIAALFIMRSSLEICLEIANMSDTNQVTLTPLDHFVHANWIIHVKDEKSDNTLLQLPQGFLGRLREAQGGVHWTLADLGVLYVH